MATRSSKAMTVARPILIGAGVLGLVLGAVVMVSKQSPVQIVGVGLWMLGAIILHDAVLSPLVLVASVLVRRASRRPASASVSSSAQSHSAQSRRVWRGVLLIVQGAVIVGAILTLVVVPEIYAKTLGTANPTILPSDYGLRLGLMWIVIAAVTAITSVVYARRSANNPADDPADDSANNPADNTAKNSPRDTP
ncbi:hypothetical protein [Subtercola frigoramans]|uniref:Uncharacterized protein n=1 Tax=Subtercola frigoramans TaxID=120298 RepID=A0ABS2L389_9MICO|nr:hypothetical protein [Subtercola frigoramans]MBM7471569.1 hypothetical protein [Subtercola frigoramans]